MFLQKPFLYLCSMRIGEIFLLPLLDFLCASFLMFNNGFFLSTKEQKIVFFFFVSSSCCAQLFLLSDINCLLNFFGRLMGRMVDMSNLFLLLMRFLLIIFWFIKVSACIIQCYRLRNEYIYLM